MTEHSSTNIRSKSLECGEIANIVNKMAMKTDKDGSGLRIELQEESIRINRKVMTD